MLKWKSAKENSLFANGKYSMYAIIPNANKETYSIGIGNANGESAAIKGTFSMLSAREICEALEEGNAYLA